MATQYKNNATVAEILNDLISIHNDRIAGYEQALSRVTDMDDDLKYAFENIILKAGKYKMQLSEKMKGLDVTGKKATTILGKIYRAWMDLKMTFTGNTRKAIIAYCKYNEDIAQCAYQAALNVHVDMNSDIRLLLEDQQDALLQTYNEVKKNREEQHFSINPRLVYFN
jgi:uncharacterized protein (TIGR02284 family)